MATPATPVAAAAPAAGTQEFVDAQESFDAAAESVLDYNPQAPIEAEKPAETAPVPEKTEPAAATTPSEKPGDIAAAKPGEAQPVAVDPWAVDAKLLEAGLAHPELGALVKTMQGQLAEAAKWREFFPSVDEAREFKSMAPGGVEELKGKVQAGVDAQLEQVEFFSGDPGRQGKVLQAIAAENPQAFAAAAKPWMETLKASNPQEFQKLWMENATEALKADGVLDTLGQMFEALGKEDEKGFATAIGQLKEWREKAGFAQPATGAKPAETKLSPELQKALDENKAYKEKERTDLVNGFTTWKEGLDTNFQKAAKDEIGKVIEGAIPKNIPTKVREALVSRLGNEMFAEIEKRLNADLDLGKNVAKVIENSAWRTNGEQTRTQVQNLYFGRAKQLLPYVTADILNPFTEATVAKANAQAEREDRSTQRTEVSTSGSAPTQRAKPLSKKDVAGMSDEQILDM